MSHLKGLHFIITGSVILEIQIWLLGEFCFLSVFKNLAEQFYLDMPKCLSYDIWDISIIFILFNFIFYGREVLPYLWLI